MIKRNNPGNIRPTHSYRWQGETTLKGERYCSFSTLEFGCRAMLHLLLNYRKIHNLNSVREIITRWAPPSDGNHTSAYIQFVAQRLGVNATAPLDSDKMTLIRLSQAMTRMKHGKEVDEEYWMRAYEIL